MIGSNPPGNGMKPSSIFGWLLLGVLGWAIVGVSKPAKQPPTPDHSAEVADLQSQLAAVTAERDDYRQKTQQLNAMLQAANDRANVAEAKAEQPVSVPQRAAVTVNQPVYERRALLPWRRR